MIEWSVDPEIFQIPKFLFLGPFSIRWYGLLFASSFLIGFSIMTKIYRTEKKDENDINDLLWYMILGTVLGARFGHCLFYNPSYYLSNPLEMLMIWKGGLASHGAAVGILLSLFIYSRKNKQQTYLWIVDRVVITVALSAFFIRMGNLFNSEIIGKPAGPDLPWSFVFTSVDDIPRHPTQLYEALSYLIFFLVLVKVYSMYKEKLKDGLLLGLFLIMIFGFRIFIEYFKENQTYFEEGMLLNMGQILSIPLVLLGLFLVFRTKKLKVEN